MDRRKKIVACAAAAHLLLSMMVVVIVSRKRKRDATRRIGISYGPLDERDRVRMIYLNDKIWKDDTTCINTLRMTRASFFRFCKLLRDRGLLEDTIHLCVEEQVGMFLHTVGHNLRNRLVATNFGRSGETVSRYFNKVLRAIGALQNELITPPSLETPSKIEGDPRWDPYFKDMEAKRQGEGQSEVSGPATWNSAASTFMLKYLAEMVRSGARTSSGFKKVHLNNCARALNEQFKINYSGDNVKNHLRTWQRRFSKILRLKTVSVAGWDEDNCIITLDDEHYTSYIGDHKSDAEFFNKPLENYKNMATIFESNMATGKYAKGSNEPIGVEETPNQVDDEEDIGVEETPTTPSHGHTIPATLNDEQGTSSSVTKPTKRTKTAELEFDPLVGALTASSAQLANAIEKLAKGDMDLPPDLYDTLKCLSGFNSAHISLYYSYLVANPHIGRAFYSLPFDAKLDWVVEFINSRFPGN